MNGVAIGQASSVSVKCAAKHVLGTQQAYTMQTVQIPIGWKGA